MVLCDGRTSTRRSPAMTIPYHVTASGGSVTEEGISQWSLCESVTPGMYSTDDYDFRKPNAWMLQARQNPVSPVPGRWTCTTGRAILSTTATGSFTRIRRGVAGCTTA